MIRRLAVIPARGGSKRFPRKNIQPLNGKPLVLWSIEALRDSRIFDRIIVSTEDREIADIASATGPYVPFMRPSEYATDTISCDQVALAVLRQLEQQGEFFDTICVALPTCPLRTAEHIKHAHEIFDSRKEPNMMSVTPFEHQPFWAQGINDEGCLFPLFPESFSRKRQELPVSYRPNGALHILDVKWFQKTCSYHEGPTIAYVMSNEASFDIDSKNDLFQAEYFLAKRNTLKNN